MKQEKGESVDILYQQICEVPNKSQYDAVMQKVFQAETLKYGLTNHIFNNDRAEEEAQMHISKVQKIRMGPSLGDTRSAEELRQQKKPFGKKSKAHSDRPNKNKYNCTRCGHKHGPKQCPDYGKECKKMQKEGPVC